MLGLIEFFSGIGGVAEACRQMGSAMETVRAIDVDRRCAEVYRRNFGGALDLRTIESLDLTRLVAETPTAQAWWLSPPCQPYCRRGRGEAATDPRCEALRAILDWLERQPELPFDRLALENVPQFAESDDARRLTTVLHRHDFAVWQGMLCPTEFGIPNRRRRYYLVARQDVGHVVAPVPWSLGHTVSLAEMLDPHPPAELFVESQLAERYHGALDIVDAADPTAITACFAGGYGRSMIRSGSYLRQAGGLRRFAPAEVARLLGFSEAFQFPDAVSTRQRWKMLGNSLSIPPVKALLRSLTEPC